MPDHSILWRRLDVAGHDACRLERRRKGWRLEGTAVFLHERLPARLAYEVECDDAWRAEEGRVEGWLGAQRVELFCARTSSGGWSLDGALAPGAGSAIDLDFGFTPATNLFALRRLALDVGAAADAPAAWLDVSAGTLGLMPQRYERRSATTYWYESPSAGYAALLEVDASGFVRRYPELWQAEA